MFYDLASNSVHRKCNVHALMAVPYISVHIKDAIKFIYAFIGPLQKENLFDFKSTLENFQTCTKIRKVLSVSSVAPAFRNYQN